MYWAIWVMRVFRWCGVTECVVSDWKRKCFRSFYFTMDSWYDVIWLISPQILQLCMNEQCYISRFSLNVFQNWLILPAVQLKEFVFYQNYAPEMLFMRTSLRCFQLIFHMLLHLHNVWTAEEFYVLAFNKGIRSDECKIFKKFRN